jgi:hypothetical protein
VWGMAIIVGPFARAKGPRKVQTKRSNIRWLSQERLLWFYRETSDYR